MQNKDNAWWIWGSIVPCVFYNKITHRWILLAMLIFTRGTCFFAMKYYCTHIHYLIWSVDSIVVELF